jgi:molecular chaperone DnaK
VALSPRGEILVGESARNQASLNPDRTVVGIKRLLSSPSKVCLGETAYRPEELAALILASLKADAEAHLSARIDGAVVTAPAHFSELERRSLVEAGRLAGLEVRRILNEPTAAALARAWEAAQAEVLPLGRRKSRPGPKAATASAAAAAPGQAKAEPSLILVYDFGGGTFDVTLLRQEGQDCQVLSSRGDGHLGGRDLDRELFRLAASDFQARYGLSVEGDPLLVQALVDQAEKAKIELSERRDAEMSLPFALAGRAAPEGDARLLHPVFPLDRPAFEAIALPFVDRSLELTAWALADAGLAASDVDVLVLSGGSSRIPLVRRLLEERFGLKPAGGVNPEEIVALGAAVATGLGLPPSPGQGPRLVVRDVVSRTYGVEIDGGAFVPLIRKNSPVPAKRSRVFTTVEDGQDSVEIHVLQGESRLCGENLSLGRFLLAGVKAGKAGAPQIRVDFSIDESDILHVSALDLDMGVAQAISIADLGRGAGAESPEELLARIGLLSGRLEELAAGLELEAGLEAELEEASLRARKAGPGLGEGALRLLKAELEGLLGEVLARRGEAVER